MNPSLPLLTLLILTPLIGGVVVVGAGELRATLARRLGLGFSGLTLALAVGLWAGFVADQGGLQFVERHAWIPTLGVEYLLGVDGLGLLMVALTVFLVPMAMGVSEPPSDRAPLYYALMLWLEAGLLGTFTALNFFHWFLFWELSLIPAFFLIRLWGGAGRTQAATQFFVYTMVGSVTLLLAFLALFLATGEFDFQRLAQLGQANRLPAYFNVKLGWYTVSAETLTFLVFFGAFLGFAVKLPVMPFHTWLPITYAEAPTGVVMLLTGAMSKMGAYGLLRILLPIFPEQLRATSTLLLGLAVFTIVASAGAAFAQKDLKRMLGYSSINHLGYGLLGVVAVVRGTLIAPPGGTNEVLAARVATEQAAVLSGVLLQMFNHGLTAATLFAFVGWLEQRSGGRRGIDDFGGLRQGMPVFCGLMGIATFASLGLPGLNGFVGEFLIFKGTFALAAWAAVGSLPGLLITAVFLLTFMQRVFHGPLRPQWAQLPDLTPRERWIVAPALLLMLGLGLWPQAVLGIIHATVLRMVESFTP